MSELFSIQLQNQQQSRDGVWLDLPTTTEQVQAALRQIGISSDNPQGLFISGYFAEEEKRFAISYNMVLASNVDELNFLASRLETLSTGERAELNAALQAPQSELFSIGRITDFPENVDYYVHLPDVHGPAQLGDYYLNRSGMVDTGICLAGLHLQAAGRSRGPAPAWFLPAQKTASGGGPDCCLSAWLVIAAVQIRCRRFHRSRQRRTPAFFHPSWLDSRCSPVPFSALT